MLELSAQNERLKQPVDAVSRPDHRVDVRVLVLAHRICGSCPGGSNARCVAWVATPLCQTKLEVSSNARPLSGRVVTIVNAWAPAETHTVWLATCSPSSLTASAIVRHALTGP
jgi:hypothetical protein